MRDPRYFGSRSAVNVIFCVIIFTSMLISRGQSALTTSKNIPSSGSVNIKLSRLHTDGRWIRDAAENIVRLKGAGVSWRFKYCDSYHDYDPLSYDDEINEASIDLFDSTGANFIRLTVNGYIWHVLKAPKYMVAVDRVIEWCRARGIMVVLDNHGWYNPDTDSNYWGASPNKAEIEELTQWKSFMVSMAEMYKNEPTVIGFDMQNEPAGYPREDISWDTWTTNVLEVIRAIHTVDPSYLCFVEPLGSSSGTDDMDYFKTNPLAEPNIVYCAHNYYAWDYPYADYAISYGKGDYELAKEQMEAAYYERWIDMAEANLPVINMETGVYGHAREDENPNWQQWVVDSLDLYNEYEIGHSWWLFDPDRENSSIFSLLKGDRSGLTEVGEIWAMHIPPP